jgi:hypothetical protein
VESGGYKITGRSMLDDVGRSAYQLAMTAMNRQSNSSAIRELQCLPLRLAVRQMRAMAQLAALILIR